jgi:hypothetical protein
LIGGWILSSLCIIAKMAQSSYRARGRNAEMAFGLVEIKGISRDDQRLNFRILTDGISQVHGNNLTRI